MRIAVRGVKKTVSKGKVYYYHRATGERITEPVGSAAFLAHVESLNARGRPVQKPPKGTLGALFADYQSAPEFTELADLTKRDYRNVINRHATSSASAGRSNRRAVSNQGAG